MEENELMTIPDVARQLKVNRQTVYTWINRGELEHLKLGVTRNSPVRVRASALANFLRNHTVRRRVDSPA